MMVHDLKVHPQFWPAIMTGDKPFEVRKNDRKFAIGDVVNLREYDPTFGYTERGGTRPFKITFILRHEDLPAALTPGYVVLGFGA